MATREQGEAAIAHLRAVDALNTEIGISPDHAKAAKLYDPRSIAGWIKIREFLTEIDAPVVTIEKWEGNETDHR